MPAKLWHPLLVMVDEAHLYCPERGSGEAESTQAVIDVATLGRKRGYCLVAATQRLSKLHKDCAAELQNKLIGRTGLDVDVKRAGDDLGFDCGNRESLKTLEPGTFYAVGPAISSVPILVRTGPVSTTHPQPGKISPPTPPPPEELKALIQELKLLPVEPSQTVNNSPSRSLLEAEIKQLQHQLAHRPPVQIPVFEPGQLERLDNAIAAMQQTGEVLVQAAAQLQQTLSAVTVPPTELSLDPLPQKPADPAPRAAAVSTELPSGATLRAGERKMLTVLAAVRPRSLSRVQLGSLSDFAPSGGTFSTYLSTLKRLGLVQEQQGRLAIAPAGMDFLGDALPHPITSAQEWYRLWLPVFRAGEQKMLAAVVSVFPQGLSRQQLGEQSGFEPTGGTFSTYLSTLKRNELVDERSKLLYADKNLVGR